MLYARSCGYVESIKSKLPNLIIAGVHKAGSTSLFTYLARHPDVCASHTKEIDFFVPLMVDKPLPPLSEYARHFAHCGNERYRMEASPSYLYGRARVAAAIKHELDRPRIVAILRDPTDRLVSYFSRAVSNSQLPDDLTLSHYVESSIREFERGENTLSAKSLRDGLYVDYLPDWQNIFGADFRVVFFDALEKDPQSVIAGLCGWLGLDPPTPERLAIENRTLHYRNKTLHRYVRDIYLRFQPFWRKHTELKNRLRQTYNKMNAAAARRLDTVDDQGLSQLRLFYEPHNRKLGSFLAAHEYSAMPAWLQGPT